MSSLYTPLYTFVYALAKDLLYLKKRVDQLERQVQKLCPKAT